MPDAPAIPPHPSAAGTRLLDSLTDPFFALDRDWRFQYVNAAAERVLRRPRAALLGQVMWDVYPEVVGTASERECRRAASEAITCAWEACHPPFDTWYQVRAYPSADGVSVYLQDIADRKRTEARAAATEAHYRRLVTTIPHAVYVLDRNRRFTEINPAAERILGRPAGDLLGQPFDAVIADADLSEVSAVFRRVMDGEADNADLEVRVRRASGEERLLAVTATAIAEDGQIGGLHGIARDITDERAGQVALRDSQRRLQQILDALPVGVSLIDEEGRQIWFNPALDRQWGSDRPLGPDRYREYVGWAADTGARLADDQWPILRALRGEPVRGERIDIQGFDGMRKATVVSAVPLHDEAGAISGAIAVQEDVTETRALEARQQLLATVFEGLREGVCVITPAGTALYANRNFFEIMGLEADAIPGWHARELAATSEAARQFPLMMRAALETGRWSGRLPHQRPRDGAMSHVDIVLNHVKGSSGDDLLFGIVQDATDEVHREQQLRRAERLASIGTLVAGVAHELNNPLQSILSFVQLLRLNARRPEDAEALTVMQREAERMAKIVADLRQVARSTQATASLKMPVDLNEVVRHVCRVQEYRLRTGNVRVTEDLGADLPLVLADRAQLEQVLLNLVVNACQAVSPSRGSGQLLVQTARTATGVSLRVVDDGEGIAREHLDQVFDPFFTTKGPGEGTGLGLSVVHGIVSDHGGTIRVESEPGVGTSVEVDWPAATLHAHVPAAAADRTVGTRPASRRVLLVDDEPAIRLVLTQFLEQRGHVVHAASDGAAALQLLATGSYDVVLSDLRMPGLGGEAMVRSMRERGLAGQVVFMTGDPASVADLARESGIELLLKPMKLEDVARVVEQAAAS